MNTDALYVLLHRIEGPVNLGAVCRAMANTGFANLRFTGPLDAQSEDARKFAVHALPLLESGGKCRDFAELIRGLDLIVGFTPRSPWADGRDLDLPRARARVDTALAEGKKVGLLFGNEAEGLTNRDLALCDVRVALPAHADYVSMNLSQAVLIALWELTRAHAEPIADHPVVPDLADPLEKEALLYKVRLFLDRMEFLDPQHPDRLWREVAPIFKTRDWSRREMQLLLAIFSKGARRYEALQRKLGEDAPPEGDGLG